MTDIDTILKLWPILSLAGAALGSLCMGGIFWQLARRFVRRDEHDAVIRALAQDVTTLKCEVEETSSDVANIKQQLEALPSAGEITQILVELKGLHGSQRELTATLNGQKDLLMRVERQVDNMDAFLRNIQPVKVVPAQQRSGK